MFGAPLPSAGGLSPNASWPVANSDVLGWVICVAW